MKCIFCKEVKSEDQFSIEHVFPESIGDSFTIDNVCKDCNSILGREVDSHLTDHPLVRLIRCEADLAGKKGNIRPFRGELVDGPSDEKGCPKVTLKRDERQDGLQGRVIPKQSEPSRVEDGVEWHKFVVDHGDKEHFVSMFQSSCRKLGQPPLSDDEIVRIWHQLKNMPDGAELRVRIGDLLFRGRPDKADPTIVEVSEVIDLNRCSRAVAKIAYELACEWLGRGYLDDPIAEKLRRFVIGPSFNTGFQHYDESKKLDSSMPYVWSTEFGDHEYSHMAEIQYEKESTSLYCHVRIFDVIEKWFEITKNREAYSLFFARRLELDATKRKHHVYPFERVVDVPGQEAKAF